MSSYERGPLLTFEVTWASGHVERVRGHQCIAPRPPDLFGGLGVTTAHVPRWTIHGEFDGVWQLVLSARDEDIHTVRNLGREVMPGDQS